MALTPEQMKARAGRLTASAVGILTQGDPTKVLNLWRMLVGDPAYVADDLSGIWAVALGSHTEELNLDWYERKHRYQVTRRGEVVCHPTYPWAACTLDGWIDDLDMPIETKHVGGREPLSKVLARYHPQFAWQQFVMGSAGVVVSIIEGANEPLVDTIRVGVDYFNPLFERAKAFMECVESLTPPVALPAMEAPVMAIKTYDMRQESCGNEWADFAATWMENLAAAKRASVAEKGIKALVPRDAQRAYGFGVEITRDRANRLSLRAA